jgi:excisionase family DNA binding protein
MAAPPASNEDRLLVEEAARLMSVSPRTLYNLRKAGRLRAVRIGSAGVRYDVADLRAFIERAKREAGLQSGHAGDDTKGGDQ